MTERPESLKSARKSSFSYNWAILSGSKKSAKEALEKIRDDTGVEDKKSVESKDAYSGRITGTQANGGELPQNETSEVRAENGTGEASESWTRGWSYWGYSTREESAEANNEATQDGWLEWVSPYRIFGGLAGEGNGSSNVTDTANSTAGTASETDGPPGWTSFADSWFRWPWKQQEEDRSDEGENVSDAQLFKIAKSAIESSKGNINYAFKTSWSSTASEHQMELAVSDTVTKDQPVRYTLKKKPLYSNEVQELAFDGGQGQATGSSAASVMSSKQQESHVVPEIDENYRHITWKTRLRLLAQSIAFPKSTSEKHIYKTVPPKVQERKRHHMKKVLVIGVHGFMPLKMVKTMIGQSTGSASKFTEEAVAAVSDWLGNVEEDSQGQFDIHSIALEGEGVMEDRIKTTLELLKNWEALLTSSDFIFVVSHSYGTPLAINLLAELSSRYHLPKKVGLLSMAGSFCGPLPGMDSKLVIRAYTTKENEVLSEFFELQKPNSSVSVRLVASLQRLLDHNVKITLAGAINDHFIPLHSAFAPHLSHPNIYRFLYVAPSCDLPPFVISLFKIAVILRNMGHNDYNLFCDLADRCVGSVAESAHSRIYSHRPVYTTAIKHSLETTSLFRQRPLATTAPIPHTSPNLYSLPWNVRALIDDLVNVRNILNRALFLELLQNYKTWNPSTKSWKELRYCFNALEDLNLDEIIL